MAAYEYGGTGHRCPMCGSGALWTRPLAIEEANGTRHLLFCGDCGAFLGKERAWHDLEPTQDGVEDAGASAPTSRWLRLYLRAHPPLRQSNEREKQLC